MVTAKATPLEVVRQVAGGRGVDGQPDHRPASRNKAPVAPEQPPLGAGLGRALARRTAVAIIAP